VLAFSPSLPSPHYAECRERFCEASSESVDVGGFVKVCLVVMLKVASVFIHFFFLQKTGFLFNLLMFQLCASHFPHSTICHYGENDRHFDFAPVRCVRECMLYI
jgi:hypothetical protein